MLHKPVYSAFLLLILFGASCRKYPHYRIDEGARAYYAFKEGSYWVYMDSATALTDTFWLADYSTHEDEAGSHGELRYNEVIAMNILGRTGTDSIQWSIALRSNDVRATTVTLDMDLDRDSNQYDARNRFEFNWPLESYVKPDFTQELIPSLSLPGKTYESVWRTYRNPPGLGAVTLYTHPDSGIIKMVEQEAAYFDPGAPPDIRVTRTLLLQSAHVVR